MADKAKTAAADAETLAAREALRAKFGGGKQLGGKGTIRRTKKAAHKPVGGDDKRLTATLKRLNVGPIPGIEEVTLTRDNGKVLFFENPKVQANLQSNIYVVTGTPEEKAVSSTAGSQADQMRLLQEMAKRAGGMEALLSSISKGGAGLGGLGGMGDGGGEEGEAPTAGLSDFEAVSE